jgi:hypothetical protein
MPRAVKRKHVEVVTAKSLTEFRKDDIEVMNAEVRALSPRPREVPFVLTHSC